MHNPLNGATPVELHIAKLLERILMGQDEFANQLKTVGATLTTLNGQLVKIGQESNASLQQIKTLTDSVAALTAKVNAGGNVTPDVQAALVDVQTKLAAVVTAANTVDDLIPDQVPVPPQS